MYVMYIATVRIVLYGLRTYLLPLNWTEVRGDWMDWMDWMEYDHIKKICTAPSIALLVTLSTTVKKPKGS